MDDPDDQVHSKPGQVTDQTNDSQDFAPGVKNFVYTESLKNKLTRSVSLDSAKPKSLPMKTINNAKSLPTLMQKETECDLADGFGKEDQPSKPLRSAMEREIYAAFYTAKLFLPKVHRKKFVYYAMLVFQYYQFAVPLIDYGTDCKNAGTGII